MVWLDWPVLVGVTLLATGFLWRGQVGRWQGVLLAAYAGDIAAHLLLA